MHQTGVLPGERLPVSRTRLALEGGSPESTRPQDVKASKIQNKKIYFTTVLISTTQGAPETETPSQMSHNFGETGEPAVHTAPHTSSSEGGVGKAGVR